eukprot:3686186-Amphidinium_carterae.6
MAESNHHKEDMADHRYVAIGNRWERVNLHWSPPPRLPKDQRIKGRASAGVVLASSKVWEAEDLETTSLQRYHREGRVIISKVHYAKGRQRGGPDNQIVVGDYNIEISQDLATILAVQTEAFVDVSYAVAGDEVLPTYECGAAATAIDRIVVSRSLWARTESLHMVKAMAMGPHYPL